MTKKPSFFSLPPLFNNRARAKRLGKDVPIDDPFADELDDEDSATTLATAKRRKRQAAMSHASELRGTVFNHQHPCGPGTARSSCDRVPGTVFELPPDQQSTRMDLDAEGAASSVEQMTTTDEEAGAALS